MELDMLSEIKDGNVLRRIYLCPCGKNRIVEEQDYTPGHREVFVSIECPSCYKNHSIVYSETGLQWKIYHDYTTYYKNKEKMSGGIKMARRSPYSKVNKRNQIRADHVKGMGDVTFKGFQCLNPDCTEFIFIREDEIDEDFIVECPICGYLHESGGETKFYDYSMDVNDD
ncbi:hypothetical protein LJC64_04095 [Ruminococcaceae bacterium OttesenSCG-928-A11]|nr:hypothetical protein [Ruminococcaceae bacterium OttesenSCG-928-A11]